MASKTPEPAESQSDSGIKPKVPILNIGNPAVVQKYRIPPPANSDGLDVTPPSHHQSPPISIRVDSTESQSTGMSGTPTHKSHPANFLRIASEFVAMGGASWWALIIVFIRFNRWFLSSQKSSARPQYSSA
eukprot:30649-Amorphochlora_amoeboformis.AAC.1